MMRRPIFHKSRTPDQTQQPTQQRTPRTPELTQHSTPEMSQHHTPDQTPQNTPRQTPDPDTSGESCTSIINGAWKVGTMHDDGRIRVEVIEGVLEPSNKCSTQITSIMHERLEPKGGSFECFHIPMTEDWLEKIFKAYGAIEYIKIITCGPSETPSQYAIVHFESCQSVRDVIRLNKKLMFTHKRVQITMIINVCDGTTL
ncbi:hypothetical protein POM88_034160 [Heracleum sosnowskyi]|uniref:RRM domain-containing protein n=1 Tax=Heracleum sosnowskyi TaxID=360622 RepID=A0AAD8HKR6_9APIA|nr:hypothetical protein POM88_034160 [Heracleum sosnowskyi]